MILVVAAIRLVRRPSCTGRDRDRRPRLRSRTCSSSGSDSLLLSRESFGEGIDLGTAPTWHALVFSLSLAMLAFTGLETVANLAAEAREPGKALPRSLFAGIGVVVIVSFAIAAIGRRVSAAPGPAGPTAGTTSGRPGFARRSSGSRRRSAARCPTSAVDTLKVFLGVTGAIVLVSAIATSLSGAGRLAYSLGQRAMLPRSFGRLNRRTFIAPASIVSDGGHRRRRSS